jgi:hypothetical protein
MDEAVDFAASINEAKYGAYYVVNPIREALAQGAKAANDDMIAGSFFHWADADDDTAANNIREFSEVKSTCFVLTGVVPGTRPHVYWELDEPSLNLTAWKTTQEGIAARFQSDSSVTNPSRVMRIAGTINWPGPEKVERGRVSEMTSLRVYSEDERPLVTSMQMARMFPVKTAPTTTGGIHIATGEERRNATDYADILARARTDGEKHTGVRDLAASLAGMGVNRAAAEAIVREACPVWDEGVENLIETAYAKFYEAPEVKEVREKQEASAEGEWPTPYDLFDASAIQPRQWVYQNHYLRSFVSVLASAGGVGKTSLQIVEALAVVTGRPLLGETVKEQTNAWIINLEDPIEEMQRRVLAAMQFYGIKADEVRGRLFIDAGRDFSLTFATQTRDGIIPNDALVAHMIEKIPEREIGLVFIDPFVGAHEVNENDNMAVNSVVSQIRDVADQTKCAIGLVHHVRKGNGEDATVDSVRGAGSLIGAARAARVINRLPEKDAVRLNIPAAEARSIFRVDDGKANLAPPAGAALYRKMEGVKIGNGEWVGVAIPYELPDEWAGMTEEVVNEILRQIDAGPSDGEHFSGRPQDRSRFAGKVISDYPFDRAEDFKSPEAAKAIIKKWVETGLLEEVEYYSAAQRKDRMGVISTGRIGDQYG